VVRRWLKATDSEMELYHLPGCSPELNPDEYLDQDVKTNAVGTKGPANQVEMIANGRGCLRNTQRTRGAVAGYFEADEVRCAAM
jgi:hypothetical protein